MLLLDDCIWGPWNEDICDCETKTKKSERTILRNAIGKGVCYGQSQKIDACDCKGMDL